MWLPSLGETEGSNLGELVAQDSEAVQARIRDAELFTVPLLSELAVVQRAQEGLSSDARRRVYERAVRMFEPDEIGEAFGAARGPAIPRQLREHLREHAPDLVDRFTALAPEHEPIAIQRWSMRRIALTVRTVVVVAAFVALLVVNLADPRTP